MISIQSIKSLQKAPITWGLFFVVLMLIAPKSKAQLTNPEGKKIEILNADIASFDSKINADAQFLIGNVKLMHKGALMLCDSALLYQNTNRLEAYGKVQISQGDSLQLFGDSLNYNGNIRVANVFGSVRLEESQSTLTTNLLRFDVNKSEAYYTTGGKIVSKKNKNILTSTRGTYASKLKTFYFKELVRLENPEYTVNTDTMDYQSNAEIAYFYGPTVIRSKENLLYAENGWYNTKSNQARFKENAFMVSNDQKLEGDSLFYDRNKGIGQVYCNITITDTVNKFLLYGDYGIHYEESNKSIITENPKAIKIFETDSLFLKADTIIAIEDSLGIKTILAYHDLRFFKSDMQGVADTLIYAEQDSSMTLFEVPIIWSDENQISGRSIKLYLDGKAPKEMYIDKDAHIVQLVDTNQSQYNQVQGRELRGYFEDKELRRVYIKGNGQTVFYAQEDKPDSTKELIGINVAECTDINILLKDSKLSSITFLVQPNAVMYPPEKVGSAEFILKGFRWDADKRPLNAAEIMR